MSIYGAPRGASSPSAPVGIEQWRRLARLWSLCTYDLSGLAGRICQRNAVTLPPRRKDIHLFHIRKTAGTSLYNAFLSLGGDEPREVLRRISQGYPWFAYSGAYTFAADYRPNRFVRPFFSFSHDPIWSFEMSRRTYKITILRDPVARVLSLFRYLSDSSSDQLEVYSAPPKEHVLASYGLPTFLRNLPKKDLFCQLYMFSREFSPEEAAANIRSCQCYFFAEDYDRGVNHLSRQFRVDLQRRHDRSSTGPKVTVDVADLRRILEPEYEMLDLLLADPGAGFVGAFPATVRGRSVTYGS